MAAHEAAPRWLIVVEIHLVSQRREISRYRKRGRAASDECNFFAVLSLRYLGQTIKDRRFVIGCDALESADRHRFFFDPTSSAGRLARSITGTAKNAGEYVRLPIDHVSVVVTLLGNQSNIFRDRCVRRAGVLAIDDLMEIFRVSDISWFHFVHFARSLIAPPK